jgi:hypothetical protein
VQFAATHSQANTNWIPDTTLILRNDDTVESSILDDDIIPPQTKFCFIITNACLVATVTNSRKALTVK